MPVHGKVLNLNTGDWIKDALIEVVNPATSAGVFLVLKIPFAAHGITGCYLAHGPNGTYDIKISAAGFHAKVEQLTISELLIEKDIGLSPLD